MGGVTVERRHRRRARELFEGRQYATEVRFKGGPYKEWSNERLEHGVVFISSSQARRWWSGRREPPEEAARAARRGGAWPRVRSSRARGLHEWNRCQAHAGTWQTRGRHVPSTHVGGQRRVSATEEPCHQPRGGQVEQGYIRGMTQALYQSSSGIVAGSMIDPVNRAGVNQEIEVLLCDIIAVSRELQSKCFSVCSSNGKWNSASSREEGG
ncbi:hypothetical protein RHGRI_029620 [Rhododendron griersonianum]|uniref:Uncharacterized protein n=1 Tax=Rhododendron griersonianum TaxID=479676 RepID=A0AAV6IKP5_9ERIC|nr:hypothetical protein RHGRI_029620 [Rhododendron griersonianum]